LVIVPSAIDSPIWGMMISVAIPPPPKPDQNSIETAQFRRVADALRAVRRSWDTVRRKARDACGAGP
jgi:hypothetical protein